MLDIEMAKKLSENPEGFLKVFSEIGFVLSETDVSKAIMREVNKGIPWGVNRPYFQVIREVTPEILEIIATGASAHPLNCLDCTMEHLARATVNMDEILKGYDGKTFADKPNHFPLAIGNLAEAEVHSIQEHSDITYNIRKIKFELRDWNGDMESFLVMQSRVFDVFWMVFRRRHSEVQVSANTNIRTASLQNFRKIRGCGCQKG
jgi:hypothetical protein